MSKTAAVGQAVAQPSTHKITLSDEQLKSGVRLAEKDDTLWDIAVALGVPLADVIKANPHINPKAIQYEGKNRTQINLPQTGKPVSDDAPAKTLPINPWTQNPPEVPSSDFQPAAPPDEKAEISTSTTPRRNPGEIQADINAAKAEIQKLEAQLESTPISAYDDKLRAKRNGLYEQIELLQAKLKQLEEERRTGAGPAAATPSAQPVDLTGGAKPPAPPASDENGALKEELKKNQATYSTPA